MKAWRLERFGGALTFEDVPVPEVRPGSVLVRIQVSALLTYLRPYVEGKLTFYNPPPGAFTPGTNGVGVIETIGRDVWHLRPGQRVVFSPHFVCGENVEDPAQILIGLTAFGAGSAAVLLGIAMGAARVIAAGRSEAALDAVARAGGRRVTPVRLTGDVQSDAASLRGAAGGGRSRSTWSGRQATPTPRWRQSTACDGAVGSF